MTHLLLGGSGVLGSGFREALRREGATPVRLRPDWSDAAAAARYLEAVLPAEVARTGATAVVWAAGVGSIGASPDRLRTETEAVRALCRTLVALPPEHSRRLSVLFASSAGALYGGHGSAPIGEHDVPVPVSAYGRAKADQEELLRETAGRAGCRIVVCRISNLYGLADGRLTARGLVSTAVRATRLRQPMTVFVSPDTRRDYVYNVDAAAVSLRLLATAPAGWSTALVRDGTTRSVSSVLSLVGTVSRRRVPASYAVRPETRLQPAALRFAARQQGPECVRRTPMETAVHLMLRAPLTAG